MKSHANVPVKHRYAVRFASAGEYAARMKELNRRISRTALNFFQHRAADLGSAIDDWKRAEKVILDTVQFSITDHGDRLTVRAEVGGFAPEELKVHVGEHEVCVCADAGHAEQLESAAEEHWLGAAGELNCKIELPTTVKRRGAVAELDDGVLTLILPKESPVRAGSPR